VLALMVLLSLHSPRLASWTFRTAIVIAAGAQVQGPVRAGDVVLRGGWMFDSLRGEVRRNTGIVVRDGSFLEVDANLAGRDLSAGGLAQLGGLTSSLLASFVGAPFRSARFLGAEAEPA